MNPCPLILLIIGLLAGICLLYGFWLEPRWIRVRTFILPVPEEESFLGSRLVYFSDLHTGSATRKRTLRRQMQAIMAQRPDAILFGGVLVEERTPIYDPVFRAMVVEALSSLKAPLGKWAIFGNHDVEAPRFRQWVTGVLEEAGFILLENQATELAGLPVWGFANTHHSQPLYRPGPAETFTLFLVHESDWFPETLPQKSQGLVLAGHSHYGQVTLFGLPLIRPAGAKRYWRGRYRLGDHLSMIVSAGLGTVHIHARFFARPDLLVLHLGEK